MIAANTIVGGRYRVIKPLGGGGMKLVYLAEDLRLAARPCALAEMVDSFTSPELQKSAVTGFQREADMLAQLNNEHIPRVFDRFSEENRHYLVMEYIAGATLEAELKSGGGKLPEARVVDIALQVLATLEYLHNLKPPVIYRDLKPSNVMVTPAGQAKLIDFGIARFFAPHSNATMVGTQGYAPPEQYRGRVEPRSDLYSLAATMHHALTGRDPAGEPPFSFPPLRGLNPGVNPVLADLIDQALKYDVALRPADAAEVRQRLQKISDGAAPAPATGVRPRIPLTQATAASSATSPEAPTKIVVEPEIICPGCRRGIPADSRFCSYCAADLRHVVLGPSAVKPQEAPTGPLGAPPASAEERRALHRRTIRRRWLIAAAIVAAYLIVTRLGPMVVAQFHGPGAQPAAPPSAYAPNPAPAAPASPPSYASARARALRDALNAAGYANVQFRFSGDTLILWGTVQSETDRIMVQTIAFTAADVISIEDDIKVQDAYAAP